MSMPMLSRRNTVTKPDRPIVAMNANARVTPPNCASTPEAAVTTRRNTPPSFDVTRAYASRAPNTATSVGIARNTVTNAKNGTAPSRVRPLAMPRPRGARTPGKGATGPERWLKVLIGGSTDGLRPVGGEVVLRLLGLGLGEEHRRTGSRRQRGERRLVDCSGFRHGVGACRPGAPLEPEVLPLVGEQELLP